MHSNNNSTFMIGKNLPDIMLRACFESIFFSFRKNRDAYQILLHFFLLFLFSSFFFFALRLRFEKRHAAIQWILRSQIFFKFKFETNVTI